MRDIAFIHKDPDSAYGVSFSDVPGCISAGDTIDEAVRNAVEALSGHARMLEADGDPVPQPRDFDAIMADVPFDLGLLEAIDAAARSRGQTRSAFLASAARREIVE